MAIFQFLPDKEADFQACIADNPDCLPQRFPDRLVVLTDVDIPIEPVEREQPAQ